MDKSNSSSNRRVSITKSQMLTDIGAELVSLCSHITLDGTIEENELVDLRSWLEVNKSSNLPSIEYLTVTVERIIEDGIISEEELIELYKSVEAILPIEIRASVSQRRREFNKNKKQKLIEFSNSKKEIEKRTASLNKPIVKSNFILAGINYEDRIEIINKYLDIRDFVFLVRDNSNSFSKNAIRIYLKNGMCIGFVPENYASNLAYYMDSGFSHKATIPRIYIGRYSEIPIIDCEFYLNESTLPDLIKNNSYPFDFEKTLSDIDRENRLHDASRKKPKANKAYKSKEIEQPGGCALIIFAIIVIISAFYLF